MTNDEKTFKIVNGDISDGYHTFGELYDHRCLLWIRLALFCDNYLRSKVFWVAEHYPGWDLIVLEYAESEDGYKVPQISYHVPVKYRSLYRGTLIEDEKNSNYDGHTSMDVINRLEEWIKA